MHWENKRSLVFDVAGKVAHEDVAKGNNEFKKLLDLIENKTIEQMKLIIRSKKKPIKEAIDDIPPKIEELQETIEPEFTKEEVEAAMKAVNAEITSLEEKITSKNNRAKKKTEEFEAKQAKLRELSTKMVAIQKEHDEEEGLRTDKKRDELGEINQAIKGLERDLEDKNFEKRKAELRAEALENEINGLIEDYNKENKASFVFKTEEAICPTCKRELDNAEGIEAELRENFEKDKARKLTSIKQQGKEKREEQSRYIKEQADIEEWININESLIAKHKNKIDVLKKDISSLVVDPPKELEVLKKEYIDLKQVIDNFEQTFVDTSDLKAELDVLKEKKEGIIRQQIELENKTKTGERIKELKAEEKKLSSELAKLEKTEFLIQEFEYKEIEMMEEKISKKYKGVKFKMFNRLINGGTEPTCEILINGVPFNSANNAAKINTGILIANTHSEHYGVSAPIFIDNAEAVNKVQKSKSQLIKLYVIEPKGDKETDEEYKARLDFYKVKGSLLTKK